MSRSYRKPYATWCSQKNSAAKDKELANRAVRRLQDKALRDFDGDWDDFLLPVRYEASGNDVWSWSRDGKQFLHPEPRIDDYLKRVETHWYGYHSSKYSIEEANEDFNDALERYKDFKRK